MSNKAQGRIERLYPAQDGTYFQLKPYTGPAPKDRYFHLALSHDNYNAIYALLLTAAVNRYEVKVRLEGDIDASKRGEVAYVYVDW